MKQLARVMTLFTEQPNRRLDTGVVADRLQVTRTHARALLCQLARDGLLERCAERRRFVPHGPATSLYRLPGSGA